MAIPPGAWDLAPLIPIAFIITWGVLRIVHSPLGQAFADRIAGRRGDDDPATKDEIERLQHDVADLQERLNFAERMLLRNPESARDDEQTPTPV